MKISFNRNITSLNEKIKNEEEKNKYLRNIEEMKKECEIKLQDLRREKDTIISKLSFQRDNLCEELERLEKEKDLCEQKLADQVEELNKLKAKLKKYEKDISESEIR